MNLKNHLNIIAACSIAAILVCVGMLWYSKVQINNRLNYLHKLNEFEHTTANIQTIIEEYLTYGKDRHLQSWGQINRTIQRQVQSIPELPRRKVINNYLASINDGFELIRDIKEHPGRYPDVQQREILLERARGRILADTQLLLSIAYYVTSNLQDRIQLQQERQFTLLQILVAPVVIIITILIFQFRKRINRSLKLLLAGTKQFAQGNLDWTIDLQGHDEHSKLAEEFNAMAKRLRNKIKQLNDSRKQLELNRQRWEKLVEQDPNMVMIHIDGIVKFINPAGIELLGAQSAGELEGKNIYDFLQESDVEKAQSRIDRTIKETEKVTPTVFEMETLQGEKRYIQVESMPIRYKGRNATQTVGLDITDRILYERDIKKSLEEKTVLLKEIHHRVKNNLAVISGLMELQAMETENEHFSSKLKASQLRIKSIASIHELLYQSENFSDLNFRAHLMKLIETNIETLETTFSVSVDQHLEDVTVNVNRAIPAALIINELVSNALEHAFEGMKEGTLGIRMEENNDNVIIQISDNGKGLPDNFKIERGNSLGVTLMNILTKQLDGKLWFETGNSGTTFFLEFENTYSRGIGNHHLN